MNADKWLKETLKAKYGESKGTAVFMAILNNTEIQFSSQESQAKFEAILKEWNRRGEDEDEDEEALDRSAYGPASASAPVSPAAHKNIANAPIDEYFYR